MITPAEPNFDSELDQEAFRRDQRKLYRGSRRHTCPDCGTPNALTDEEKRRGYHCGNCTRAIEEGF